MPNSTVLMALLLGAAAFIIVRIALRIIEVKQYEKTSYYKVTGMKLFDVEHDAGRYGEYLIYMHLSAYEQTGAKFLFNLYLPKPNGETTEVDLIMITKRGILAFESKNYSGWIFGDEYAQNWCQTLPAGKGKTNKEYFYNPIMQNRTHIRRLQDVIGQDVRVWSVIVFSERCTLKDVTVRSPEVFVMKRPEVKLFMSSIVEVEAKETITQEQIDSMYALLYPFTQVSEEVKARHIESIRTNPYNS